MRNVVNYYRAHRRYDRLKPWRRKLRGYPVAGPEWEALTCEERYEIELHATYHGYKNGVDVMHNYPDDDRLYTREPHPLLLRHRRPIIGIEDGGELVQYEDRRSSPGADVAKVGVMVVLILCLIAGIQFVHLMGDGLVNFPKELAAMLGLAVFAGVALFFTSIWRR